MHNIKPLHYLIFNFNSMFKFFYVLLFYVLQTHSGGQIIKILVKLRKIMFYNSWRKLLNSYLILWPNFSHLICLCGEIFESF